MGKTEKQTKSKIHYAWWILVSCCLINASAIGLTNSNGLFYPVVAAELGVSLSALSIHTVVFGITSAIAVLFVERAFKKFNIRLIITVSILVFQLSYIVMGLFHTVLEFCIASVFTGISCVFLFYVPVPMLINNWFVKFRKTALSICFVAAGVSGILNSLLLGWAITAFGWRWAYVIRGVVFFLVAVPAFFLIRKKPEEMGLKPYGAEEAAGEEQKIYGQDAERHSFEEKRIKLIFAVFIAVTANLSCGMTIQLPAFFTSIGLNIVMASVLTSMAMIGNISSKALFGPMTEKFGATKVSVCLLLLMGLGWLFPVFGFTSMGPVCIAAFVTGFSACANTLIIPNLADTFVKGDEYVHVIARCSTGTMIAGTFTTMISSALVDLLGDFSKVFLCYTLLQVVNIAVLILVFGRKKNKK